MKTLPETPILFTASRIKMLLCFLISIVLLLQAQSLVAQAKLWGVMQTGGSTGGGAIFTTNNDGTGFAIQKSFVIDYPGFRPNEKPILGPNGKLYGITSAGGPANSGVLYEFDPTTNVYVIKVEFTGPNGSFPIGKLLLANNGKIYGTTTYGGLYNEGTIFEFDPTTSAFATMVSMKKDNNFYMHKVHIPKCGLMQAADGYIYGVNDAGGQYGFGGIFRYTPGTNSDPVLVVPFSTRMFQSVSGGYGTSIGAMTEVNGKLYGLTSYGGSSYGGTLFEYQYGFAYSYSVKVNFTGTNGWAPKGSMIFAPDGNLYGAANGGGTQSVGVFFRFNPATYVYTKLRDFDWTLGSNPTGELVLATNGKIYGTSSYQIFEYDFSGAFALKYSLPESTVGGLTQAPSGKLYGNLYSCLYEFDLSNSQYTKKFTFGSSTSGSTPTGRLTRALNGKFYGTAMKGGANSTGMLFEIDPITFAYAKKADFSPTIGSSPTGCLTMANNGKLYGTALEGGLNGVGALFEYDPSTGSITKRHDFATATGRLPYAGLIQASNGKLYGLTSGGGLNQAGTIFEFDPATLTYTKKFDLVNNTGSMPKGELIEASNGKLYGLTSGGGPSPANSTGVLFEFNLSTNQYVVKYNFYYNLYDPSGPNGSLVQGQDGNLYGIGPRWGSSLDKGAVFKFNPTTNVLTKNAFGADPLVGLVPIGSLTISDNGKLYGVCSQGGPNGIPNNGLLSGNGTLFEYDMATGVVIKRTDFPSQPTFAAGEAYFQSLLLHVIKTPQTITFNSIAPKTYGDAAFNPATASSGLPVTYLSSNPQVATGGATITIVGAGTATITATQAGNATYDPAVPVQQLLTVNKAGLSATSNATKVYGTINPAFPISYTGFVNSDNASMIDVAPTASTTATQFSNVGSYPTTLSGGTDNSYIINNSNGTLTITKATLTATANNQSKTYCAGNPAFTVSYSGFLGSDNASVIDVPASASTNATTCSDTGAYTITPCCGSDNNYTFNYVNGTLTINKANQSISFGPLPTKTYGDPPFSISASASSGLSVTFTSSDPSIASVSGATVTIVCSGSVTITANQSGNSNYNPAPSVPQALTVNANPPTISPSGTVYTCTTTTITASSGSSYLWSNGATTQSINVGAGNYTVQVSGCSVSSAATTVALYGNPTTSLAVSDYNCSYTNVYSTTAGSNYEWSTGASGANLQYLTVNASGNYWVKVQNAQGCWSAQSTLTYVYVQQPTPVPNVYVSGHCDGSATVWTDAPGPNYYWWHLGWTTSSSVEIPPNNPGWYYLQVNYNGCTSNAGQGYVTGISGYGYINQQGELCSGSIVTLTAGSGSGSGYQWSGPGSFYCSYPWDCSVIAVDTEGYYTVTYNDGNGCPVYASHYVVNPNPGGWPPCNQVRVSQPEGDTKAAEPIDHGYTFGIYPNPANDKVLVVLSSPAEQDNPVQFIDMLGRIMKEDVVEKGVKEKTIRIENLNTGIYLMDIKDNKRHRQRRLIITR